MKYLPVAEAAVLFKLAAKPKEKVAVITLPKTKIISKQEIKTASISITLPRITPVSVSRVTPISISRVTPVSVSRVTTKPIQIQVSKTISKPEISLQPRVRTPLWLKLAGELKKKEAITKMFRRKAFELQVRRAGKFRAIGKPLPFGRAKALGAGITTRTLAQTFRLVPKGETEQLDVGFEVPSRVFTRLKKPTAEYEWVERRGMTLKRFTGEVPEIMAARRRAGGRIKWL